jgi:hypothetical protein
MLRVLNERPPLGLVSSLLRIMRLRVPPQETIVGLAAIAVQATKGLRTSFIACKPFEGTRRFRPSL